MLNLVLVVFKFPFEVFLETFSHLNDHRDYIQGVRPGFCERAMEKEHVERSTAIRNLTMTCRPLRGILLPVLWKDTEGCRVSAYPHKGYTYGLYSQCEYLLSNPVVAAYVQCVSSPLSHENVTERYPRVLSVDLCFKYGQGNLMEKFVDALLLLPNLRKLDILSVNHRSRAAAVLKRKGAIFPNVREMVVEDVYQELPEPRAPELQTRF